MSAKLIQDNGKMLISIKLDKYKVYNYNYSDNQLDLINKIWEDLTSKGYVFMFQYDDKINNVVFKHGQYRNIEINGYILKNLEDLIYFRVKNMKGFMENKITYDQMMHGIKMQAKTDKYMLQFIPDLIRYNNHICINSVMNYIMCQNKSYIEKIFPIMTDLILENIYGQSLSISDSQ